MATVQYSYAQIESGFCGAVSSLINPNRIYGQDNRGFWAGKITGTEAKMLGRGNANMFLVSVDGGAYAAVPNTGTEYTIFTGLSDTEHDVVVTINTGFGSTNGWWEIGGSYVLEVTGASPSVSTLQHSYAPHGDSLISSGQSAPIANYPIPFSVVFNSNYYSKAMLRTSATEIVIILTANVADTVDLYYSVDGGAPIIVTPTLMRRWRITGLSGEHTYNFWVGRNGTSTERGYHIGAIQANAPLVKVGARLDQFGDSISHRAADGSSADVEYHRVAAHFGRLGHGWAISGWTVNNVLTQLPNFSIANTIGNNDVAVLAIGRNNVNDITTSPVLAEYQQIIDGLLALGYVKVLCRGILPEVVNDYSVQNAAIENLVVNYNDPRVSYVDVSGWFPIDRPDGVHPSVSGFQTIYNYAIASYAPLLSTAPTITATLDNDSPNVGQQITVSVTTTNTNSVTWAFTGGLAEVSTSNTQAVYSVTSVGAFSVTPTAIGDGGTTVGNTVTGTASALSTLVVSVSNIPNGTYTTTLFNSADDLLFRNNVAYTSGAASIELPVLAGTAITGYILDNNAPHTNGAVITGTTA